MTHRSLNLAGRPSRLGGTVVRVVGLTVLALGILAALVVGAVLQALFPAGVAGWVAGTAIAVVALVVGLFLTVGGRSLHRQGVDAERQTRIAAVFALAAHKGGMLTAGDVAQGLELPGDVADDLLTELAKVRHREVSLEVDEKGGIYFRFPQQMTSPSTESRPEGNGSMGSPLARAQKVVTRG